MTPLGTPDNPIAFDEIARLADDGDNVAIATRRLDAGLTIRRNGTTFALDTTVMVGHRFAIEPVAAWRAPTLLRHSLRRCTQPIEPGEYVRNAGMIEALDQRSLDFSLPQQAKLSRSPHPTRVG